MNDNYMQRVNPNLIITLHYSSKALWLVLAAVFGLVGYKLYALGVQSVGDAKANLLGISFTLNNAGPGLVVMVMALLCSLIGAVKSKVELTPEAIRLTAPREDQRQPGHPNGISDPGVIDRIETLERVWGLTEIAALYRVPVADLVSETEKTEIVKLQSREPLPEQWPHDVSSVVRGSRRFEDWLHALPNRDLPAFAGQKALLDRSLPWCIRLRWGARVAESVDIFVYGSYATTSSSAG
jgi:hypothetical protein